MKFHDTAIGLALMAFGLWIVWTARSFPQLTGQPIGAGTFPIVLGSLCAIGGLLLALQALRTRAPLAEAHPAWALRDRQLTALVMIGGALLLALTFERVGFPIGGSLLLIALFLASGHRHWGWMVLSVVFVVSVHILLTRFLLVPLPSGILKGVL